MSNKIRWFFSVFIQQGSLFLGIVGFLSGALFLSACKKKGPSHESTLSLATALQSKTPEGNQAGQNAPMPDVAITPLPPLVARGKTIYQTQCIACHHSNPRKPGAIGPDVYGSSRELLELRILHGKYPPGYQPKRPTQAMAPLPHLKYDISAIHAYLNSD